VPTVLRDGPYSFVFFSSDQGEPPHIHVKRDADVAKFWLDPVRQARSIGFRSQQLNQINRLVVKHQERLMEAWHVYFGA
jgi:hypothetical protein